MENKKLILGIVLGIFLILSLSIVSASYENKVVKLNKITLGESEDGALVKTPYLRLNQFDYDVWVDSLNPEKVQKGPNCPASACEYDCYDCSAGQTCTSPEGGVCVNTGEVESWTNEFNMAEKMESGEFQFSGFLVKGFNRGSFSGCSEGYFEVDEIANTNEVDQEDIQENLALVEKYPQGAVCEPTYTCHGYIDYSGGGRGIGVCSGTCPAGQGCYGDGFVYFIDGTKGYRCSCKSKMEPIEDISSKCTDTILHSTFGEVEPVTGTLGLYSHQFIGSAPMLVYSNLCEGADINLDVEVDDKDLIILNDNMDRTDCTEKNWCNGVDLSEDGNVNGQDLSIFAGYFGRNNCSEIDNWCNGVDLSEDGNVNGQDLSIFAGYFGKADCHGEDAWCNNADIDRNGLVNQEDFSIWQSWNITKAC
jgi:hypothetical protein